MNTKRYRRFLPALRNTSLLFYAILTGLLVGYISTAYRYGVEYFSPLLRKYFSTFFNVNLIFLMPVAGSIVLVIIITLTKRDVKDMVPEVIEASIKDTYIKLKDGIVCVITSLVTLVSGGSAGPEGPMAFVGASVGSFLARKFHLDMRHAKIFLAAGAAAGIASIFNAPMAGVLFALELILLNDLTMSAVTPVILSSVAASTVTFYYIGDKPTFIIPAFVINSYWELFVYALIGVTGGVISVLFCKSMSFFENFFHKQRKRFGKLTPLLGSAFVGIILLGFPQIGGYGHDYITTILGGSIALKVVACLVFLKILGTSMTLQSGNSGGIFAPALFIGAAMGATFGYLLKIPFPTMAPVSSFATVGMAAVMAGTIHAPLTAMMLIFEVTRNYHTILPLMTATVLSTLVAYGMGSDSLYISPLKKKHLDFRHIRDLGALADVHASELMRSHFQAVFPDDSPEKVREKFKNYPYNRVIYMSRDGRLLGFIPRDTFHLLDSVPLPKLARSFNTVVNPSDTLYETLNKLRVSQGLIPVVDGSNKVIGIISDKIFIERYLPLLKVHSARRSNL